MTSFPTEECRAAECRRPIIWTVTSAGKSMPVDAEPVPDGTILVEEALGQLRSRVLSGPEREWSWVQGRKHTSHFATCPAASTFRKPRGTTHQRRS